MKSVIILKGWIKNTGSTSFPLVQLYYNSVKPFQLLFGHFVQRKRGQLK